MQNLAAWVWQQWVSVINKILLWGQRREWEEVQHYCIDYFQLYFHLTLALDHLYRQSFRDLHYLSSSSAAAINLALYISLSLSQCLLWSLRGIHILLHNLFVAVSTQKTSVSISVTLSWNSIIHFHTSHHTSCNFCTNPIERLQSHYFCIINVIDQNRDLMDGMGWRALCLSAERGESENKLEIWNPFNTMAD